MVDRNDSTANDKPPVKSLGPLELQLMDALWDAPEPLSVQGVVDSLGPGRNYKTVMTVLNRLVAKGLLDRELDGRAYRYHARQPRADFLRAAADELVHEYLASYGDGAEASLAEALGVRAPTDGERREQPAAPLPVVAQVFSLGDSQPQPARERRSLAAFIFVALALETAILLLALARRGVR